MGGIAGPCTHEPTVKSVQQRSPKGAASISSSALIDPLQDIVFVGIVSGMDHYFTNTPIQGRVRSGEYPFAIGVLDGHTSMPRGIAFEVGETARGIATWKLKVRGAELSGRFIIDNGRFVPVPFDRPDPSPDFARRIETGLRPSTSPAG